jgi:hypothetical protein
VLTYLELEARMVLVVQVVALVVQVVALVAQVVV